MHSSTTTTIQLPGPTKPKGWCKEQGIAHSWESGPTLMSNPPISTRECVNCGQVQWKSPGDWTDK
jgi:hypothetical protein